MLPACLSHSPQAPGQALGRAHCQPRPCHRSHAARRRPGRLACAASLRLVRSYDASFKLDPKAEEELTALLAEPAMCRTVAHHGQKAAAEFTGILFQPVPWSPSTKKGMPADLEHYATDPQHIVINIPPQYMFKAKIFKPSRLCAVYRVPEAEAAQQPADNPGG